MKKHSKPIIRRLYYSLLDTGEELVRIPLTAKYNEARNAYSNHLQEMCGENSLDLDDEVNEIEQYAQEHGFVVGFSYAMELFTETLKKEAADK